MLPDGPAHIWPPTQPLVNPVFANLLIPHERLLTAHCIQPTDQHLTLLTVRQRMLRYIVLLISILISATTQLVLTQIP